MVQVSKQINGGDKMDECFKQRKLLADEFKKYQKVFVALGDENRQNIFFVLLENDKVGMRVPDITKKNTFIKTSSITSFKNVKRSRSCQYAS